MTSMISNMNPLTHKEQIVLREIGLGLSSKEIANKLYLSDGTVRNYTSAIIDKMEADNRFEAWKKRLKRFNYFVTTFGCWTFYQHVQPKSLKTCATLSGGVSLANVCLNV